MPQHTAHSTTRFAGFSDPVVYSAPSEDSKPVQHLLWGDWLRLKQGRSGDWREVHARGCDGWMHKDHIQTNRILEVVFVDIGQGDGCLVVTPDDEHIVIDAGEDDSMYRFLHWRYNGFKGGWTFAAGIMERRGSGFSLGPKPKHGKHRYVTDLIRDKNALGATGRHGRGNRPLIFSTELGRSASKTIRRPEVMKARLRELRERDSPASDRWQAHSDGPEARAPSGQRPEVGCLPAGAPGDWRHPPVPVQV